MPTTFELYVTYQQVTIFDPAMAEPFNFWDDKHVAQGFSWRPQSAAFGTLDPDGKIEAEVCSDNKPVVCDGVVRAIVLPFERPKGGKVEVASISESRILEIPDGVSGILFEAGIGGDRSRYKITFLKGAPPLPQILVADAELDPPKDGFLMHTEPG